MDDRYQMLAEQTDKNLEKVKMLGSGVVPQNSKPFSTLV